MGWLGLGLWRFCGLARCSQHLGRFEIICRRYQQLKQVTQFGNYLRTINIKQLLHEGEGGEGPAMLASKAVVACGLKQPRHEQPEVMRLIFGQKQFYLYLVEQIRNGILSPIVLKIPISI